MASNLIEKTVFRKMASILIEKTVFRKILIQKMVDAIFRKIEILKKSYDARIILILKDSENIYKNEVSI